MMNSYEIKQYLKLNNLRYYISAKVRNIFTDDRNMKVIDWLDINHPGEHDHFINSNKHWYEKNNEWFKTIDNTFNDVIREMQNNKYPKCIGPLDTIVRDWCFHKAESLRLDKELNRYEMHELYKCLDKINELSILKNNNLIWNRVPGGYNRAELVLVNTVTKEIVYGPKEFGCLWDVSNIIENYYEDRSIKLKEIEECIWNFRHAQQSSEFLKSESNDYKEAFDELLDTGDI